MTSSTAKPLITANQVTIVRLLPMPLLAWLLYGGPTEWWIALILGTVIGCTDWVDGMLARKHGPTVLGALLDPMADKIFIAFAYLPLAHIGLVPAWAVALLFVREFLITGLRTAFEGRGIRFKTSYLAKVKTWVQMQGVGVLILAVLVDHDLMVTILVAGTALAAVVAGIVSVTQKKVYRGAVIMVGSVGAVAAAFALLELRTFVDVTMYSIVALTWVSGLDYIIGGVPQLMKSGGLHRSEAVRILGSIAIPTLVGLAVARPEISAWPLMAIVAMELSVGGLDNLLAHHKSASSALSWAARVLSVAALLGLSLATDGTVALAVSWTAVAISAVGVTSEFWRGREHYLEPADSERAKATLAHTAQVADG